MAKDSGAQQRLALIVSACAAVEAISSLVREQPGYVAVAWLFVIIAVMGLSKNQAQR